MFIRYLTTRWRLCVVKIDSTKCLKSYNEHNADSVWYDYLIMDRTEGATRGFILYKQPLGNAYTISGQVLVILLCSCLSQWLYLLSVILVSSYNKLHVDIKKLYHLSD